MASGAWTQAAIDPAGIVAGQDLTNAHLPGAEFVGRDLTGTTWAKADLRGSRFTQCELAGADFTEAYLNGAVFQRCDLSGATLNAAIMPGVYLGNCDMSGATFSGAFIGGAALVDVTISPTGATHLPALRAAFELHGDALPTDAMLAAASGDAFAFSYQATNPDAWPGTPMTSNPLLLALDTLGYDASLKTNIGGADGAKKELISVLRRGLVALVPMRLAGGGLTGNAVEGSVWVAVHHVTAEDTEYDTLRIQTPFGPMDLQMEDLLRRWRGPWPTLVPAGDGQFSATYALCTVGAKKAELSPLDIAIEVMRNASAIVNEPRSFADAYGGLAAYEALISDLKEPEADISRVILWSAEPRAQLVASRQLAAAFLREVSPSLPEAARVSVDEAATLYEQVVMVLRDEWPLPGADAFEGDDAIGAVGETALRKPHATAALEDAMSRERRAIALLEQAVADAVRAR